MRVLHFNDHLEFVGGAEKYARGIVKLLRENGVDAYLVGFGRVPRELNSFGESLGALPNRFERVLGFSRRIEKRFLRVLTKYSPDIVHIHTNKLTPWSISSALRAMRIPVVWTVHDYGALCPTAWAVRRKDMSECGYLHPGVNCLLDGCLDVSHLVVRSFRVRGMWQILPNLVALVSPSRHLATALRTRLHRQANEHVDVHVLRNFLFVDKYPYVGYSEYTPGTFLFVGALHPAKGVDWLIRAFSLLSEKRINARLVIVGRGSEAQRLKKLAAQLGISVKFEGFVSIKRLMELYSLAHAVCVPSVWMENSPFVIYESFAFGKLVVGNNRGGIRELIKEAGAGILANVLNTPEFANAVQQVLELSHEELEKVGKRARRYAEREFDPKRHVRKLLAIYDSVV